MPSISVFYGISIYMYFLSSEHKPSHIHAYYGEHNAVISIDDGSVLKGRLPNNALKLVSKWLQIHRSELQMMWEKQEFKKLAPLDEEF